MYCITLHLSQNIFFKQLERICSYALLPAAAREMSPRSSPKVAGSGGRERTPDMRERRKSSLELSLCILLRTRYFTLALTMDHSVVENKQKKHRLPAGFFEPEKKHTD